METIKGSTEKLGVKPLNDDELDGVAGGVRDVANLRDMTPEELARIHEAKAKALNATTEEERKMYEQEWHDIRREISMNILNGN